MPFLGESISHRSTIAATLALPKLSAPTEQILKSYRRLLHHSNADIRGAAAAAVKVWGASAAQLEEDLERVAFSDPKDFVRQNAVESLAAISAAK